MSRQKRCLNGISLLTSTEKIFIYRKIFLYYHRGNTSLSKRNFYVVSKENTGGFGLSVEAHDEFDRIKVEILHT